MTTTNSFIKKATISAAVLCLGTLSAKANFVLFGENTDNEVPGVRPISAPYFHEDSYVTTGARAWYVNHQFYDDTLGGELTVAALQVRVALTESLQFVAYKDGYAQFDDAAVLNDSEGWNDIGAGLKWAFIQDWENQFHMAAGIGYEFAFGDDDVLQNTNELRLWLSANKAVGKHHFGATLNYIHGGDTSEGALGNANMITAHLHYDYEINKYISPVVEVNGYFVVDDGAGAVPFSGVDAVSVAGGGAEDTITGTLGAEVRPLCDRFALRAAYETELTDNVTLFGHRWTVSAVYEF